MCIFFRTSVYKMNFIFKNQLLCSITSSICLPTGLNDPIQWIPLYQIKINLYLPYADYQVTQLYPLGNLVLIQSKPVHQYYIRKHTTVDNNSRSPPCSFFKLISKVNKIIQIKEKEMAIFNIMMDMSLKHKSSKLDKKKNLENSCGISYSMYTEKHVCF